MCFSLIAGKAATTTGSVLLAANDDWPGCPGHVHHVPRRTWNPDDSYLTVKGQPIPQPALTFGYTYSAAAYETGTLGVSWADGINDQRVAVTMQGVYAFANYQKDGDLLEADDLVLLMLQRGKSARHAIETAGALISQYGYTVSTIDGAEGTVCMAVADPEEGFFLELGPGGYWCARRVADDHVECRPNCFGIGDIDFNDTKNFICSPGLYDLAVENGLIQAGEVLNFAKAFGGDHTTLNPSYGGALNPVNMLRKWRVVHALSGQDLPLEAPVYDCVPSSPLSVRSLMTLMRDSLEGTRYDLSQAPEAGPYHNPFWMEVSTSIAQSGTVICMIADLSPRLPQDLGSTVWFSYSNARLAPFVPCYTGGHGLPAAYQRGECGDFNLDDAWWAFQETAEICYRNYETIVPTEVIPVFEALEDRFFAALAETEQKAAELACGDSKAALTRLTDLTDTLAAEALETTKQVAHRIKGKYLCNTVLSWL